MRPELVSMITGGVLLLGAVLWRVLVRYRVRTRLACALRDRDPAVRAAAVRVAVEQGLRRYARLLLERIDRETDQDVRAALVDGVRRNAWEPADQPAILRLRLWAHQEHGRPEPTVRPRLHQTDAPAGSSPAQRSPPGRPKSDTRGLLLPGAPDGAG